MGNIGGRGKFEGGYIFVKYDKPFYYPGNTVYGKIYIRTEVPMSPKHVEIEVSGIEKCSYMKGSGKHRRRHYNTRQSIEFKGKCFTFTGALNPGDYTIPFEFALPENMPASMMWDRYDIHDSPKATVKYHCEATLVTQENTECKYEQMLVVHEPPVAF